MNQKAPPITKDLEFEGSSLDAIRGFPAEIKHETGYQLDLVQRGLEPKDWKPMSIIGAGVKELRLKDADGWYRVVYVAKFEKTVYVLHAFQKKTSQTSRQDIELATTRYKNLVRKLK